MHPVRNISEAEGFIKEVNLIKQVFEGTLKDLEKQADAGIYPPEFVYGHVIEQLNEFISFTYEEHPLFTQFMKKVNDLDITSEEKHSLEEAVKNGIDESVTPGFYSIERFYD